MPRRKSNVRPAAVRDHRMLADLLLQDLDQSGDLSSLRPLSSTIERTLSACLDQALAGQDVPWCYHSAFLFAYVLGRLAESLSHLAKAVQRSDQMSPIEAAQRLVERLQQRLGPGSGLEPAWKLLAAAAVAKRQTAEGSFRPCHDTTGFALHPSAANPFVACPLTAVILAGSSSSGGRLVQDYSVQLREAFADYRGYLISGGTRSGVGELAGDIAASRPAEIIAVGYVPAQTGQAAIDPRYCYSIRTAGDDFSCLEPLQYWHDLLAAGVDPRNVKLLGIGGGAISAFEYRLALALGATVVVLPESGRAAAEVCEDPHWNSTSTLIKIGDIADVGRLLRIHDGKCDGFS